MLRELGLGAAEGGTRDARGQFGDGIAAGRGAGGAAAVVIQPRAAACAMPTPRDFGARAITGRIRGAATVLGGNAGARAPPVDLKRRTSAVHLLWPCCQAARAMRAPNLHPAAHPAFRQSQLGFDARCRRCPLPREQATAVRSKAATEKPQTTSGGPCCVVSIRAEAEGVRVRPRGPLSGRAPVQRRAGRARQQRLAARLGGRAMNERGRVRSAFWRGALRSGDVLHLCAVWFHHVTSAAGGAGGESGDEQLARRRRREQAMRAGLRSAGAATDRRRRRPTSRLTRYPYYYEAPRCVAARAAAACRSATAAAATAATGRRTTGATRTPTSRIRASVGSRR